jgi:hypothetical protein
VGELRRAVVGEPGILLRHARDGIRLRGAHRFILLETKVTIQTGAQV